MTATALPRPTDTGGTASSISARLTEIAAVAAGFADRLDDSVTAPVGPPDLDARDHWLQRAAGPHADQLAEYLRHTGFDIDGAFRPVRVIGDGPTWLQAAQRFVTAGQHHDDLDQWTFRAAAALLPRGSTTAMTDTARQGLDRSLRMRLDEVLQQVSLPPLLSTHAWISVFDEFPGLLHAVGTVCHQWATTSREMLDRLAADSELLRRRIFRGTDPGPIREMRTDAGDRHGHGRSVTLLEFADGRGVVYKTKNLQHSAAYQELLTTISRRLPRDIPLHPRVVIDRGSYGWEQLVTAAPCADGGGFRRFYYRLGAHLALMQLLGGRDMWADNLVAAGEHPMFIDLECLLHRAPLSLPGSALDSGAHHRLAESVVATSMVLQPWSAPQDLPVTDVSCLSDAGDVTGLGGAPLLPLPRYRPYRAEPGGASIVTADPTEFGAELAAGYRDVREVLAAHRAEFADRAGPLQALRGTAVRHIKRQTWDYYKLIAVAVAPAALRSGLARQTALAPLLRLPLRLAGTGRPDLLAATLTEIDEIQRFDIPLFLARPDSTRLFDGTGRDLGEHFSHTAWDDVIDRLNRIDDADTHWHLTVLRSCLDLVAAGRTQSAPTPAPQAPDLRHRPGGSVPPAPASGAADLLRRTEALTHAETIGDTLLAARVDGHWIGRISYPASGIRTIDVLPADLGSGMLGIAVFLAELGTATGAERFGDAAREILSRAFDLGSAPLAAVRHPIETKNWFQIGGYAGPGAVAHAAARVGAALGDAPLVDLGIDVGRRSAAAVLQRDPQRPVPNDAPIGRAGLLLNLCSIHDHAGRSRAASAAVSALVDPIAALAHALIPAVASDAEMSGAAVDPIPAGRDSVVMSLARAAARVPGLQNPIAALVTGHRFDTERLGGRLAAADTARSLATWDRTASGRVAPRPETTDGPAPVPLAWDAVSGLAARGLHHLRTYCTDIEPLSTLR